MEKTLESFLNLWNKSMLGKLVIFVLLPLVVVAFGLKLYIQYQTNRANESLKDANKEHDRLEKEKTKAVEQAEESRARASALAKSREENSADKVDNDWHLKE